MDRIGEFVAGWNTPGYLPEMEPHGFASFEVAKAFIAGALQAAGEEASRSGLYGAHERAQFATAVRWVETLTEPAATECMPDGFVYWIERTPCLLPPVDEEVAA